MILVFAGLAWAGPTAVDAVTCAAPVRFEKPYRWSWSAERAPITDATALIVQADPTLLRPRDLGQAVLYVEGWPAEVLWVRGDEALILAPLALPGPIRAWFGPETLPEQVDAAARKAADDEARDVVAVKPERTLPLRTWGGSRAGLVQAIETGCAP